MQNTSGVNPLNHHIIVKKVPVQEKTAGGIILPDETKDREKYATMKATLIAKSPLAFNYDDWPKDFALPEPGDKLLCAKYAGISFRGSDGEDYDLVTDTDVLGQLKE